MIVEDLPGAPNVPVDRDLAVRRLRMAAEDIVRLRGILVAYDGLASAHGDRTDEVVLMTPRERAAELDALLDDLALEIALERIA